MSNPNLNEQLFQALKQDLSTERVITAQVMTYIADQYGYPEERLADFFAEKYPALEDYEVDLTFSYLFTPTEADRLRYAGLLGRETLTPEDVRQLTRRLDNAALTVPFVTPMNVQVSAPLRDVSIERLVGLLKLDQPVDVAVYELAERSFPADLVTIQRYAREEVWRSAERRDILLAFLNAFQARNTFSVGKVRFLTDFARTNRPKDFADFGRLFESLIAACESDQERIDGRGFHDQHLKEIYEDNEIAHLIEGGAFQRYEHIKTLAMELLADYREIPRLQPEFAASLV